MRRELISAIFLFFSATGAARAGDFYASARPVALESKDGVTAALISGGLRGTEEQLYMATAVGGQSLTLLINPEEQGALEPSVVDPAGGPILLSHDGDRSWSAVLPVHGVYRISIAKVVLGDRPVHYKGYVSIR